MFVPERPRKGTDARRWCVKTKLNSASKQDCMVRPATAVPIIYCTTAWPWDNFPVFRYRCVTSAPLRVNQTSSPFIDDLFSASAAAVPSPRRNPHTYLHPKSKRQKTLSVHVIVYGHRRRKNPTQRHVHTYLHAQFISCCRKHKKKMRNSLAASQCHVPRARNPSTSPFAPSRRIWWARPTPLLSSGHPTPFRPAPPVAFLLFPPLRPLQQRQRVMENARGRTRAFRMVGAGGRALHRYCCSWYT